MSLLKKKPKETGQPTVEKKVQFLFYFPPKSSAS